jgi:16S rRNA (guanine527-N7)-methyltransferase
MMQPDRVAHLLAPFVGGVTLGEAQLAQLATYLDLLVRWNARMNLTSVRAPEEIVTRHFGESLFTARHLYPGKVETGSWKLFDVGSGAGFPGLPIKIWKPALHGTLLESNQRKATFLREVVRTLQLSNVDVFASRAEDYVQQFPANVSPARDLTVTLRAVERFEQVLSTAVKLLQQFPAESCRLALLIGAAQVESARAIASTLAWSDALPIPKSAQRVLLVGNWR